jgi:hypothetical protein
MSKEDPIVKEDEERLEHLEEDIEHAREHLKEQTHEGEHYLYEDPDPEDGAES